MTPHTIAKTIHHHITKTQPADLNHWTASTIFPHQVNATITIWSRPNKTGLKTSTTINFYTDSATLHPPHIHDTITTYYYDNPAFPQNLLNNLGCP